MKTTLRFFKPYIPSMLCIVVLLFGQAMLDLAYAYQIGEDVPQDISEAQKWYGEAAKRGNAEAMTSYGAIFYYGELNGTPDFKAALEWFTLAAETGDSDAMWFLGNMYYLQ